MELTPNLHAFLWTSPSANNCNTYLLRSLDKNILIDPGHAPFFDHVERDLRRLDLSTEDIDLVICTHAHPDHMEAVRLFDTGPALFALHEAEWQLVEDMAPHLNVDLGPFTPDFFLKEGELTVGDLALEVYHTPGHSPGGVSLYWPTESALVTGDLIFNGGLGRTDLPGGSGEQLKESIRRMAVLDAEWMLSGHGAVVSGADAVKANFRQVEQTYFSFI